jgi:hypothetical protein
MATADVVSGITVNHPETVHVEIEPQPPGLSSARAASRLAPSTQDARVFSDLAKGGLSPVGRIDLRPARGQDNVRAAPGQEIAIDIDLKPGETAALLLETDGVYSWRSPDAPVTTTRTRTANGQVARFTLSRPSVAAGTRGVVVDWLLDKATGAIRAYAFRFLARSAVGAFTSIYEKRSVRPGLIRIAGFNASKWVTGNSQPDLPQAAPAKILLMLHGTFSSTAGSFGALTGHPAGRSFLASAYDEYDAVLGYDHSTLADEPEKNAADILAAIAPLPKGSKLDVVSFSRGGLVARILLEQLLPASNLNLTPEKVVFIGCTNGGTHLAEPKNLEAAIDVYTNIIAAGARVLALIPPLAATGAAISTGMDVVAGLVRYIAEAAIEDRAVPGLAAMQPGGTVLEALNGATGTLAMMEYFAITSSFEPDDNTPGFTKSLKQFVVDRVVDRIFANQQNDLVVDTSSMAEFGKRNALEKDRYDYGDTPEVYHTIYFAQQKVAEKLSAWLDLPSLPAKYVMPVAEVAADAPLSTALRVIDGQPMSAPVLIRREEAGPQVSYYVRPVGAFAEVASSKGSVISTLQLHESNSAMHVLPDAASILTGTPFSPWARTMTLQESEGTDAEGDVAMSTDGTVLGVKLPPPRELLIGIAEEEVFRMASRNTVRASERDHDVGSVRVARGRDSQTRSQLAREALELAEESVGPEQPIKPDETVNCEFSAEMPPQFNVGHMVELIVTVSREAINIVETVTSRKASATVKETEAISLQVLALKNCTIVGPNKAAVKVPGKGAPVKQSFVIKGTSRGEAEIIVTASQGSITLITFSLKPFVGSDEILSIAGRASLATASKDEDRLVVRIFEAKEGNDTKLRFLVDSKSLNIEATSDPIGDVEVFISGVFRDLESAMSAKGGYANVERRLRNVGSTLWGRLVPADVRRAVWKHRDKIAAIQVISEEPFIPWELAVMAEEGEPLPPDAKFLAEFGLVRWIQNQGWPGPRLKIDGESFRYVVPNYSDDAYKLDGAKIEVDALLSLFGKAEEVPARIDDIVDVIRAGDPPEVLHFICHGEANAATIWDASLLLEGETSEDDVYIPEFFTTLDVENAAKLQSGTNPGTIVFLNACRVGRIGRGLTGCGGFAHAFLRPRSKAGASVFIGPQWNVNDETAVIFAQTFYKALMTPGKTLVGAANAAREAARSRGDTSWLAYSVYGDPFATRS